MVNQEKKDMMRLKAYAIWWDEKLGNVKLHQMNDMKKMLRKGKNWYEKDAQKGKTLNWKRCPNGKRLWWERWKMVYLLLIFLFRQLN